MLNQKFSKYFLNQTGLKRRQLQLYVEKWFKDHGFTSNSSSKVEFKTFGEVATIQNGNKHKRKKLEKKKKHDQNDIVETPPNKVLVLQKDESKKTKANKDTGELKHKQEIKQQQSKDDKKLKVADKAMKADSKAKSTVSLDNNEDLLSYMIGCIMGGMVKSYFYLFFEEI